MELDRIARTDAGLTPEEIRSAVEATLEGRDARRVLILPPDITRIHSGAGVLTRLYYHLLTGRGAAVDILPALGTHSPMTPGELTRMFGDIPHDRFLVHDWRRDVVPLGEIPADFVSQVSEGLWSEPVPVEISRRVMQGGYDLILSIGQVVPHEVAGMSNHAKNLFVGVGGSGMINASHMIGALYGLERVMGRDHTPVRRLFDYGMERFMGQVPVLFILTVTTVENGAMHMHGLFTGEGRDCLTRAVALAQKKNIIFLPHAVRKCVVRLDPTEYRSTWLGNKAVYRTRMAIADGGELLILAPGIRTFGEDPGCDRLIRKYGYRGRDAVLEAFRSPEGEDLRAGMSAAAHLIHGSSDGRFRVTYAVDVMDPDEIRSVGYTAASWRDAVRRYDPDRLRPGLQQVDGEEIFYVPDPGLGLWIAKERFEP